MRLLGLALVVVVALGATGSAQAVPRALVYGEALTQPTALPGETLVGAIETVGQRDRWSVLAFGANAAPVRLISADVTPTGGEEQTFSSQRGYAASESHLAVLDTQATTTPQDVIASSIGIGFGPRAGLPQLERVFDCDLEGGAPDPPAFAVEGDRLAVIAQHCGAPRLLVREGGTTRELPVVAGANPRRLEFAGPFVAYEVSISRADGTRSIRTVVARTENGEEVFSVDGLASGFALAPDGTLVVSFAQRAADRSQTCVSGRLVVATPADPAPRDVPGARPCGDVELAGDRVVHDDPEAQLRATALTGESVVLARRVFAYPDFDGAPGRVAVLMPSCAGSALYVLATDGSSGEPEEATRCVARLVSATARVVGRTATVRFACPSGCAGYATLRLVGASRSVAGTPFFAAPGRRATAQLRLPRSVARRVRQLGRRSGRLSVLLRLPDGGSVSRTLPVVLRPAL